VILTLSDKPLKFVKLGNCRKRNSSKLKDFLYNAFQERA